MVEITIFHNPACGTSRNTLALIRHAGFEPRVVEYLKTPLSKDELRALVAAIGIPVRALIREKEAAWAELLSADRPSTDEQLLDAIVQTPILMNRPVVVTPLGTRLCRPSEAVLELLPVTPLATFTKEDGQRIEDPGMRRAAGHRALRISVAAPEDAAAITAIYAPIVAGTAISFELEPPSVDEMRGRIVATLKALPWLVAVDADDAVVGYVYASPHRERPAYRWSVDTTAYVREDRRGQGAAKLLYQVLFEALARLGHCEAFAGIALPNRPSVALHESLGFAPIGVYRRVGFKLGAWHDVGWWQRSLRKCDAPEAPAAFTATRRQAGA